MFIHCINHIYVRITERLRLEQISGDHLVHACPQLKHGHIEHIAQDHVWVGFEYIRRRKFYNLFGQPVPLLCHPYNKVFPHIQMEPHVHFILFPLLLILLLGTTEESGPITLTSFLKILINIDQMPSQPFLIQVK